MCTAAMQDNLPDFLKNPNVTGVSAPQGSPKGGAQVPLGPEDADTKSILQRRERIRQAQDNPGSHVPTGVRSRKDIMDELT